jgi:hypothetical protein
VAAAKRNQLAHCSILQIVKKRQWQLLIDILARDLRELPMVTPAHLRDNIPIVEHTIQAVINE